ncbi:MAG: tRNA pseudouridine(54/55) synthase Pus10 [Desulfurococcaceae archaeon]
MNLDFLEIIGKILDKSEKILSEYPLCNSCLGRIFAKYGLGLSNYERGLAIKTLLSIKLHIEYTRGLLNKEHAHKLAVNAGEEVASTYRKLYGENIEVNECYICRNKLTKDFIREVAEKACELLKNHDAESFLVGITLDKDIVEKELEILVKYGLESSESIKRELKREIGKAITSICGIPPDFTKPSAVLMIELNNDFKYGTKIQVNPLFYSGIYWKLGRNISHVPWYTKTGSKKYPLSIQEAVEKVFGSVFNADEVVIHAAGREDVDARMLGSGRPLIIEVKSPRKRIDLNELKNIVENSFKNTPVVLSISSSTTRGNIARIKEHSKRKRKIYRVTVYVSDEVKAEELKTLDEYFVNREITQRTPTRILRRKKDLERKRKVYMVKSAKISNNVFEALVYCDGGLYVKELVHCDNGRTTPCFAGILGKKAIPVELDVLYVEE